MGSVKMWTKSKKTKEAEELRKEIEEHTEWFRELNKKLQKQLKEIEDDNSES